MGARQYPIWFDVVSCIYNSTKSFGARKTSTQTVYVGSSSKNSRRLARISVTNQYENGERVFRLSVDGVVLKTAIFKDKDGRAKELIEIITSEKLKETDC